MKIKKDNFNKHYNIYIGKQLSKETQVLFFSDNDEIDLTCETLHYKKLDITYAEILRDVGIAKSISQAKGALWLKEVKVGFDDLHLDNLKVWKGKGFGKRPHRLTILKEI